MGEFCFGGVFAFEGCELKAEFMFESGEAALPAGVSTDYGGVDDEAFPEDGGDDVGGAFGARFGGECGCGCGREKAGEEFVVRWEGRGCGGEVIWSGDLAEGQIFGEAPSGALFLSAGEESEEGSSGRVGPGDASGEPGGNFSAAEGLFHERLIAFRAA